MTSGALRKNIENQADAINHTHLQPLLKIALLGRRQLMIENDQPGLVLKQRRGDFVNLARPGEQRRIRPLPATSLNDSWI